VSVASSLHRARRLNNRTIPWAFTDLVAAAVQCLPSCTKPKGRDTLVEAVAQAARAGAEHWPEPARELFERCAKAAEDRVPVLLAGLIGPALDVEWPDPRVGAWTRRKDIGTAEEDL
jgi:hypothetical protein